MENNIKTAIILINYNGLKDTNECINSIQKLKTDVKIVVVDNASTQKEGKIIADLFPEVHIIESKINLGYSGGNNLGIDYALENNFEYIMLLNNDTVIDTNLVNEMLRYANNTTVTVPKMYYYSEPDRIWYGGGRVNRITGNAKHEGYKMVDDAKEYEEMKSCTFATGCCLLIHRDIFAKVGKLDNSFFMYCEDTDFCIRLIRNGIQIKYVPMAKLYHKIGSSSGGDESAFSIYYMTRNRLLCIAKHKTYFSCTAYPYTLITRYIRMIQYRFKGKTQWWAFRKAITDFKKGINGRVEHI